MSNFIPYINSRNYLENPEGDNFGIKNITSSGKKEDLKGVASEFESLFIFYMLKTMREAIPKSGLFDEGSNKDMYDSIMDQELSKKLSKSGGIGLYKFLLEHLQKNHKEGQKEEENEIISAIPSKVIENYKKISGAGSIMEHNLSLWGRISSNYGYRKDPFSGEMAFHKGVDFVKREGEEIFPAMKGTVIYSGREKGYGNVVIVKHESGYETLYAHNSKNIVRIGDTVNESTPIAYAGQTGRTTGSHLHFEIRKDGNSIDPLNFFRNG